MIKAASLTKHYGNKIAVDSLDFTVEPGRVTGFLGPNGAGKSTTMRMILGLDRPTSGSVTVNGRPYTEHRAPLCEVGALLDARAAHKSRTAFKHLLAIAATHGIGARRVRELMEIRMPGIGGIESTRRITELLPDIRVLVLTTYDRDEFAFGALRAGAAGFLLKNTRPEELVAAIRTVHTGDSVVSPRVTTKLIEVTVPHLEGEGTPDAAEELAVLSGRERDVFLLVGQGGTNTEIAQALFLSESTVKTHFGRVLLKLGRDNRVQVVIRAYELGVVGGEK